MPTSCPASRPARCSALWRTRCPALKPPLLASVTLRVPPSSSLTVRQPTACSPSRASSGASIEGRLGAREGIAHVLVTGDRRPYLVALVDLDEREMLAIARRERLGCRDHADLARHPRIRDLVAGYVDELNAELPRHETIKKFAIVPEPLTSASLTPTQKVKRRAVEARYAELIAGLYA